MATTRKPFRPFTHFVVGNYITGLEICQTRLAGKAAKQLVGRQVVGSGRSYRSAREHMVAVVAAVIFHNSDLRQLRKEYQDARHESTSATATPADGGA